MCQTAAVRYLAAVATCAILTLTGSFSAGQAPDAGKRVALLVGVNKYDKRNFRDLEYAERDVEELAKALDAAGYEVHLLTGSAKGDKRATLENVQKHIEAVLKGRTKKDLVLVALAGHGLQIEETGGDGKLQAESFFCPADVESGNSKTMLSIGRLFDEINRRGGGHNLVLVDACREDPTRGRGMDGSTVKTLPEGVAVLFGCRSGQKTFETKNAGGGHGVFFHYVLKGLRGEARNDRGDVTWDRLVEFVRDHVDDGAAQLVGDKSIVQTPNLIANLPGRSPVLLKASKSLFDGRSLAGWRSIDKESPPTGWHVEDGAIVGSGDKTYIATVDSYTDFELELEWKLERGANAGVYYRWGGELRSSVADGVGPSAPEYQIVDNVNHPNGKKPETAAASVWGLLPPSKDATNPVGEWNATRLVVRGKHVEHWLNGEKVVEYDFASDDWARRVAAHPRFSKESAYGRASRGRIALQSYSGQVWYRDIRIKEIETGSR